MTRGPIRLDVSVGYALPRAGLPAAVSFRKWVAAALDVLRRVEGISVSEFSAADVVRHPLVAKIVQAYDRRDETRSGDHGEGGR